MSASVGPMRDSSPAKNDTKYSFSVTQGKRVVAIEHVKDMRGPNVESINVDIILFSDEVVVLELPSNVLQRLKLADVSWNDLNDTCACNNNNSANST